MNPMARRDGERQATRVGRRCIRCGSWFVVHAQDFPKPMRCRACDESTEREPDENDYPPAA